MSHRRKAGAALATITMVFAVVTTVGFLPATALPAVVDVNDDSAHFTYLGDGWEYMQDNPAKFQGDDHFAHVAGAKAEFRFAGTRVVLKGAMAGHHGTATVSVDGDAPVTVSQTSTTRQENVAFYTSPVLAAGTHVVTVMVASGTISLDSATMSTDNTTPTTTTTTTTPPGGMPRITVNGNTIQRGGQDWWLTGYNSFVWTGDCGHPDERMTQAQVDAWFASMRHDGHGAVRLFFYQWWDLADLDAAVASAKRHNVYLTITLNDAIGGCGENDKTPEWFADQGERDEFRGHMETLLRRYHGETAIAWFEYFNEPGGDDTWSQLREFYDTMGDIAHDIDPQRLFASGTVAPYWLGGEANFRAVSESRGVDIVSLHEYDENEVVSNHYPRVKANSAGKPIIVGEFGLYANENGDGCAHSFTDRATKVRDKLNAYIRDSANAGAFGWAWQPGGGGCEYGNFDADQPSQHQFRTVTE